MRSRVMVFAAVVVAVAATTFTVSRFVSPSGLSGAPRPLPTGQASYLGVYERGTV